MMNLKCRFFLLAALIAAFSAITAQAQFTFDRPKTEPPLDNPYNISLPREKILEGVRDILKTCALQIDTDLSKPNEGKIVTKPINFSKGVTTKTDLEYLSALPAGDVRNWVQGRFSLEITALPLDQKKSQLLVSANIQGRIADPLNPNKWIDCRSNGRLEDEVLRGLAGKILGIDLSQKNSSGRSTRRILTCEY
ncbi:MAG TPA: hypothetical protein PLK30_19290 [Blastocatellia bacterium]|nr:hypothetical protein [Blastocatellia bacterium]